MNNIKTATSNTSLANTPANASVKSSTPNLITPDPWAQLKSFTQARIALGRAGTSLPTQEVLNFGMAHAMARDAVHIPLDTQALENRIQALGFSTLQVHSQAPNRACYLLRPDWGRRLNEASIAMLQEHADSADLVLVVGDGLSSMAVAKQAPELLKALQPLLPKDWRIAPVIIASQARVAIGDDIAMALKACMVAVLIGERPGLSSPDSLGIYLTYQPQKHTSDADRNCISNVRPEGLAYDIAAQKLIWLAQKAMKLQLTGVALKDESDATIPKSVEMTHK